MSQSGPPGDITARPLITWFAIVAAVGLGLGAIAGVGLPGVVVALTTFAAGTLAYRAHSSARFHRLAWTGAGLLMVLALIATAIPVGAPGGEATTPIKNGGGQVPTSEPLLVASTWPIAQLCDVRSNVAMPAGNGGPSQFHSKGDIRTALVDAGGGAWKVGFLRLDLSVASDTTISIVDIKPHRIRPLSAPAWVYKTGGGCGGAPYREFNLGLDDPMKFVDAGVNTEGAPPGSDIPTAPLGPDFSLSQGQHAVIKINAYACNGNYEWSVKVRYLVDGSADIKESGDLGPFQVYSTSDNTVEYFGQDSAGVINPTAKQIPNGSDPSCSMKAF